MVFASNKTALLKTIIKLTNMLPASEEYLIALKNSCFILIIAAANKQQNKHNKIAFKQFYAFGRKLQVILSSENTMTDCNR